MIDNRARVAALQKITDRYEILEEQSVAELDSEGVLLRHKKSGARVALLLNEDDNKVFSIGFRTTPKDSTGVAHIVEHTVLCGSKRFPAKDSFVELVKGSLNTFLNAFTYPDKTVYPVASCNEQDFKNLMHVYLDAVFFPNIYVHKEIFRQEGWHIEEAEDGTLSYNGVVYNEMKGALSSPEDLLFDVISRALFPDNTYREESGGDPAVIPQLSYEQFLEFHRTYYHPSNSYIYLYGDLDVVERLEFLDREYLSKFDVLQVNSQIPMQSSVQTEMQETYSAASEESGEWLAYNTVIGHASDTLLMNACEILEYALVEVPGAPVKQALLAAGIGQDVRGMLNTDLQQPVLTFLVKDAPKGSKERFQQILTDTLQQQLANGLNKKSLLAAINYFEFRYREADFGYPKGLVYGLTMLSSWLYEETKPFEVLEQGKLYQQLRMLVEEAYFEQLIQEKILDNPHQAMVVLSPEQGRSERMEEEEQKKLSERWAAMTETEKEQVRAEYRALQAYQERQATEEELASIPMLERKDINPQVQPLVLEEASLAGRTMLRHLLPTNGIVYLKLLFDISDIPEEEIPYLNLLAKILGYVDTEHYSYGDYASEMLLNTGGITTGIGIYSALNQADSFRTCFEVRGRYLESQNEKAFELVEEMLFHTCYEDKTRLKEILAETVSRLGQRLQNEGHRTAISRGMSYVSASGLWRETCQGVTYYRFVEHLLSDFENQKDEIYEKLHNLATCIFTKERLIMSVTAEENGQKMAKERLNRFVENMPSKPETSGTPKTQVGMHTERKNEAFVTPGQVCFVARMGNYAKAGYEYTGALRVLNTILSYEYLWNEVRVKGGAYGCFSGFGTDGDSYLVSYRDPALADTEKIYERLPEYLEHFEASDREITKYIIGTFSNVDAPLSPAAKGSRALTAWMRGMTDADFQKERDEILATTQDTIRGLAPLVNSILEAECRCTVGSESQIEKDKELFNRIVRL